MLCPNCQTANAGDAKFCENCGFAFERICPNCGKPNSLNAKFCRNCGYRLGEPAPAAAPAAPPPEPAVEKAPAVDRHMPQPLVSKLEAARATHSMHGERRIVTVLFCDVKGSTAMAEQLDPEEWADIMNAAFEQLITPVYRYEGTVARLMGDALLAFFGAPIAHEDDPQRAVLAGLGIIDGIQQFRERIRRERGLDFNVRVGINTGLVVVGDIGSDLKVEYTAMGDAVNLAARMEQTAQPGTVQISGNTYRLVAPLFEVESLGGIEVKGKSEPVPAYRVLQAKAAPGRTRGIVGLESPLVGRERELSTLTQAVARLRAGQGQVVSLIGEAGLGKSRLIAELRQQTLSGPAGSDPAWIEGRSLSYESTTPYAPFGDLFRKLFALRPDESDAQKYAKLTAPRADLAPAVLQELAPFVAALLGIRLTGEDAERVRYLDPPQRRQKIFDAVQSFCEHLTAARPVVLVCEDVHWIDPTSLELLLRLAPLSRRTRLLLIALFRPHTQDPSWQFHTQMAHDLGEGYCALTLEPLDEHNSRELVANLLHIEDLPEKVRALILSKAEGNPFYVEEVVRSLLDMRLVVRDNGHWRATREIENIAVPDTLAGVITARLDRLDEDAKRTARTAAVIGREFPLHTLADVFDVSAALDPALAQLQQRELVREKSRLPERVYVFKHALTQETAYASILLRARRDLHRRVAESLERREPERVNDIARHFVEAQESARALPYLVESGERASRAYATREAIGYFDQALTLLPASQDARLARRVYEGLGGTLTLANEVARAVKTYEAMYDYARTHDDVPMQVSALNKLSLTVLTRLGEFPTAQKYLDDAERLAREYHDKVGLSEMSWIRCMMCTASADFDGVMRHMDEAIEIGRELNVQEQMAQAFDHVAGTQLYMLNFEKSIQAAREGLRVAREVGDRLHEAEILAYIVPFYYALTGKPDIGREFGEAGLRLAVQIGASAAESTGALVLGNIARQQGNYERAIAYFDQVVRAGQTAGQPWMLPLGWSMQGNTYLDISPDLLPQAALLHNQSLAILENPVAAMTGATSWAELGSYYLLSGEIERASEMFHMGLAAPTMFMHLERPRLLLGSAAVARERGQLDEAERLASEARDFAEQHGIQPVLPPVALLQAQISAARGEPDRALEFYSTAEMAALPMNMRPLLWQARAGAARVLAQQGRADESAAKRHEAWAMVDEIAALFSDQPLRGEFVAHAHSVMGDHPA